MLAIDMTTASIIYVTSFVILLIGYLTAISSKDVIRLLISLELMFGAVFMALIPLFSVALLANAAFGIAIVTIFTSSGELLILIAAIAILDKQKRDIFANSTRPTHVEFINPDDSRTSKICQKVLRGKHIWRIGDPDIQIAPLHWSCRSSNILFRM